MKKILLALCLVSVLSVCHSPPAALGVELDRSFGKGGIAAAGLGVPTWRTDAVELASGGDGSTVVATKHRLLRYLPDGELDRAFGSQGALALEQVEGHHLEVVDVAVDPAGRIVVFGTAQDLGATYGIPAYVHQMVHPTYAVVLRFDATGQPDPGFGGGDGIVRTDLGMPPVVTAEKGRTPPLIRAIAGTVDANGLPIFVAATYEHLPGEVRSYLGWARRLVVRLTPGGDLDPGFSGDGVAVLGTIGNRGLSLSPAGDPIYVWGRKRTADRPSQPLRTQISRLGGDGTLSPEYGTDGVRGIGNGGGAVLDRFGRLVVLDRPEERPFRVFRLMPDGSLDAGFGRRGRAIVKAPGKRGEISSLAVDRRGRVLLVGASGPRPAKERIPPPAGNALVVGRLKASGSLDRGFGRGGWSTTRLRNAKLAFPFEDWNPTDEIVGPEAELDGRGRLIVGASSSHGGGGVVLARYLLGR